VRFSRPTEAVSQFFGGEIARGKHLFPFRTEPLSLSAPMVLGGQPPGRVGRRRSFHESRPRAAFVVQGLRLAAAHFFFFGALVRSIAVLAGALLAAMVAVAPVAGLTGAPTAVEAKKKKCKKALSSFASGPPSTGLERG
jgi:hypothetical protein